MGLRRESYEFKISIKPLIMKLGIQDLDRVVREFDWMLSMVVSWRTKGLTKTKVIK